MSTAHSPAGDQPTARTSDLLKVTIHYNDEARFMRYQDGQRLTAVTCHWLTAPADNDPVAVAEWAYRTFNADLDDLETERDTPGGETTFLAACVYRLLGHRSLSVGDVVEIHTGTRSLWLACDPVGWRPITEPSHESGEPLSAATVYQHLADQRSTCGVPTKGGHHDHD